MNDLIYRQDVYHILEKAMIDRPLDSDRWVIRDIDKAIRSLPSADRPTTDCTKFLEWLKAEVLDEENWELNAVANGEIICRKFRKLGWLDVEDGYYVDTRPTVDKEYLIDLIQESVYDGEACAKLIDLVDRPTGEWTDNHNGTFTCDQCGCKHSKSNFCPNCGAMMMRGEEE